MRIELRQNGVAQRDRLLGVDGHRHIGAHLRRMREHIGNVGERRVTELQHVGGGVEVGDGVLAEISRENEGVVAAIAEQHLVGRGAGQRIVAGGAGHDRRRRRGPRR